MLAVRIMTLIFSCPSSRPSTVEPAVERIPEKLVGKTSITLTLLTGKSFVNTALKKYLHDPQSVVADHVRTVSVAIADGALPENAVIFAAQHSIRLLFLSLLKTLLRA
jgi:hypothetical protein